MANLSSTLIQDQLDELHYVVEQGFLEECESDSERVSVLNNLARCVTKHDATYHQVAQWIDEAEDTGELIRLDDGTYVNKDGSPATLTIGNIVEYAGEYLVDLVTEDLGLDGNNWDLDTLKEYFKENGLYRPDEEPSSPGQGFYSIGKWLYINSNRSEYNYFKLLCEEDDQALRWASAYGHLEAVKSLVEAGADIHARDDDDFALRSAAENGHLEIVRYLLEHGADIHARDDLALYYASGDGHLEVVKYLLDCGANIHACQDRVLYNAAYRGHLEIVKYLIEHGADIHARHDWSLYCAAGSGHLEIVRYLIECGADLHTNEDAALSYAAKNDHYEVVEYLIECGADIHAWEDDALRYAVLRNRLEVVKYLCGIYYERCGIEYCLTSEFEELREYCKERV